MQQEKSIDFFAPRLTGKRFDDHSIPLEVLKDLSAFQDLICEVAKNEYLKDHPERKRIPRKFMEDVELNLSEIREGSAIPVICITFLSVLGPTSSQKYLEAARDTVIKAISKAELAEEPVKELLPEKAIGYFDKIGQSFKEDEAFEFSHPTTQSVVKLNRSSRKKLIMSSSARRDIPCETSKRGKIPMADQQTMEFKLELADHKTVKGPIEEGFREVLLEASNGYTKGVRVLVKGIGRFNNSDQITGFQSIQEINILEELDVPSRIDELRGLEAGWLDGYGKAPSQEGLDWFSNAFENRYPDDLALPYIYPTEVGGLRLEWTKSNWDISLDIDLTTKNGSWHAMSLANDDESVKELNMDSADSWNWFSNEIRNLSEEPS